MLVSLEWLNSLVDVSDKSPEQLSTDLTMTGLEIEEIEYIKPKFTKVYTAKVTKMEPHPDADKLRLVHVDYGFGTEQVVCGAKNVTEGQTIAFALEGATVFNRKDNTEFKLKKTKIRGIPSAGMVCAAGELCLEGPEFEPFSEGIIALNEMEKFKGQEIELGQPIEKVFNLKEDVVLHTAPTANRGDLMSMRGIANELSALYNRPVCMPEIKVDTNSTKSKDTFDVDIKDDDTCKYYAIGLVKNVKIGPSPAWMVDRLKSSGVKSINNVVDITNYVLLELGQPLHAFDYDKLPEKSLCVRRAKQDEEITTLDEVERKLNPEVVVISTPSKAVALAGVMGDFSSEVDNNTVNLAIESAFFPSATNRKSGREVGLRTEASARFERGVDIKTCKSALERCMQLVQEYCQGETAGIFESGSDQVEPILIDLRFSQVKRVLGIDVPADKCLEILKNLDFKVLEENDTVAKIEVPSYRANDVTREIDLIEEISRIYGYDKIENTVPAKTQSPQLPKEHRYTTMIKEALMSCGLNEVVTSSLTGYPLLNWCGMPVNEDKAVKVTNPQSEDYTMLRQSMIPGILQVVKHNIDNSNKDVWIFDVGRTYFVEREATKTDPGVDETLVLAGAITGCPSKGAWNTKESVDFFTLKGVIENLLEKMALSKRVEFTPCQDVEHLHPGRAAYINIMGRRGKNGKPTPVGVIGQVHPQLNAKCKLGQEVYTFEINLAALIESIPETVTKFKKLATHPSVVRDIAFAVDDTILYNDICKTMKKAGSNLLKDIDIFDVYKGQHIEEGQKSLAVRLTLQDPSATLTDDVVDAEVKKVKEALVKAHQVTLR